MPGEMALVGKSRADCNIGNGISRPQQAFPLFDANLNQVRMRSQSNRPSESSQEMKGT
jgi:hypothetical protein